MSKKPVILLIFILGATFTTGAQGLNAGPFYQKLLMNNPAVAGSEADGVLRLSYLNYYPGNSYDLNSVYLSYDSYFPGLHGGAGIYLSEDYLGGIVNDFRSGFSYAYYLQAGKDLYMKAGLTASVFHRGYRFGNAVFPDQIDPVGGVSFPTSEVLDYTGKTVLDIGAGILVFSGKLAGGFAVNHLSEPELSSSGGSTEKIKRRYTLNLSANLNLNDKGSLKAEPLLLAVEQGGYFSLGAGTSIESSHLALNTLILYDNGQNFNIQSGFSFNFSSVSVFYNYQFNALSGNSLLPLSLLHEVGLAFSLIKVEKRNAIKTINFPKL